MKKLFGLGVLALLAAVFMVSCSDGNSPSGTMKKVMSLTQDENYDAVVEYFHFGDYPEDKQADIRKGFASMLKEKGSNTLKKKGGLKKLEIISEEITEDGNSATVKYKLTYGNGEEETDDTKLVKVDEKWMMDVKK